MGLIFKFFSQNQVFAINIIGLDSKSNKTNVAKNYFEIMHIFYNQKNKTLIIFWKSFENYYPKRYVIVLFSPK